MTVQLTTDELLERCLEIEFALLEMGMGYGDSLNTGKIPWLISPYPFYFTPSEIKTIQVIGERVLDFYKAIIDLYRQERWVRQLLDLGKPKEVLRFQEASLGKRDLPRIFRVDLMMTPERELRVVELSIKPGGSVMTAAAQFTYGRFGHNIAGEEILVCYQKLLDEANGPARFIVPDEKWEKLAEFEALADLLRSAGYEARAAQPQTLDIPRGCFVYSYLPPRTWAKYLPNLDYDAAGIWTPPSYVFLKEKALFAILRERKAIQYLKRSLGGEVYDLLDEHFIPTFIVREDQPPIVAGRKVSWKEIAREYREAFIKVSGFFEKASGAAGAVYGQEVSAKQWQSLVETALRAFKTRSGLYVFQPTIEGLKVPVRFLDPQEPWELKEESRYLRLLAYFFVLKGEAVLGGIEVNSRNRIKVHLQEDATSVPGAINED